MSKNSFSVGIDLGTSTSEICIYRNGKPEPVPDSDPLNRSPIIPSVVALDLRGKLIVGNSAKRHIGRSDSVVIEVKRLMGSGQKVKLGDKEYRPEEISAFILKQLKYNAELYTGQTISDVVLSVPANFSDAAKNATMTAGKLAGLNILRLINEPTAAALAFGIDHMDAEELLMVFDLGGGTLDITIMEMMEGIIDVKCSYGDTKLGGKDFDEKMQDLIIKKFKSKYPTVNVSDKQIENMKLSSEEAKIMLSAHESYSVYKENVGVLDGENVNLDINVHRNEFEGTFVDLIKKARTCIRKTLSLKNLNAEDITKVILVGGSTYIPAIRKMVEEELGKKADRAVDPDLAVCIGASIQAALSSQQIEPEHGIILADVAPKGLGLNILFDVGQQLMVQYDELISPNTTIPYSIQKNYSLLTPDQPSLEMKLYQDTTGKAARTRNLDDADETKLAVNISDIPPSQSGFPHDVIVDFSYDLNGLIKLSALIPATGQQLEIEMKSSDIYMNEKQIEQSKKRIDTLWEKNPNAKKYEIYIKKAEKLMPELDPEQKKKLSAILNQLKEVLAAGDTSKEEDVSNELINYLYELNT